MEWTAIRERRAKHLTRVWFLALTIVCSEFSPAGATVHDFLCHAEARKMMNKVKELEQELAGCSAGKNLFAPIRLPCTRVHAATWRHKPISERTAEILLSLRTLVKDVHDAKIQNPTDCTHTLLQNLEHNINNYIHTLTHLHTKEESEKVKVEDCPVHISTNLGLVLKNFGLLISGKLERLMTDMMKECPPNHSQTLRP